MTIENCSLCWAEQKHGELDYSDLTSPETDSLLKMKVCGEHEDKLRGILKELEAAA